MNYFDALQQLGNKESRKLANNTYLNKRGENTVAVTLHNTDILTYHADGRVIINNGGYETNVTRDRINQFAPAGFAVKTVKRAWIAIRYGVESLYQNGVNVAQ